MKRAIAGVIDVQGWIGNTTRVISVDPHSPDYIAMLSALTYGLSGELEPRALLDRVLTQRFTASAFLRPPQTVDLLAHDMTDPDELPLASAVQTAVVDGYLLRPVIWRGTGRALLVKDGELRDANDPRVQYAMNRTDELTSLWELVYPEELEKERANES